MSRAMGSGSFHQLLERARARLFPPSKWAGLFPSAAYRRSAPPQVAWSILKWRCLGCVYVAWMASQRRKTDLTFGASHTQIVPLGIIPHRNLDIFVTQKASVGSNPRWHFASQKYPSCSEASQAPPFEYAPRQLRGSRAAIGSGEKKARPFRRRKKASTSALRPYAKAGQLHCARHCELPLSKMGNKGLFPGG